MRPSCRLLSLTLGAVLLSAAPAAATTARCAKTATVKSGTVVSAADTTYDDQGNPTMSDDALDTVRRGPLYIAVTATRLDFQSFDFRIAAGSLFGLNCSGAAGESQARDAMLDLPMGRATVRTGGATKVGAIGTAEMLLDPFGGERMEMTVTRTPKGDPSIDEVLRSGPLSLFAGTSRARRTGGQGYLNITPHIGRKRETNGLCHQARKARIVSTGRASDGFLKGKIRYWHLSPTSPG